DPHGVERGLPATARLYLGQGWYCGVAPVPEARVNVGIVLREGALRRHLSLGVGVAGIADDLLDRLPRSLAGDVRDAPTTDAVCVALPLAHRVTRPAGDGFLLIGDAAGFLDPLSGEGIYRALVSAEIAADSITRSRLGDKDAFDGYADRMRGRFAAKDLVSQMLQLFLARPELAEFALRRMASRDAVADTFGQVLVDQLPASRVLGPRFLAGLLRP
ncbi:MAG: hypothetical protein LH650_13485, partial [Chloroflexi bacterium]|nr:hypothetical protein [Chloroflexota bacterium]